MAKGQLHKEVYYSYKIRSGFLLQADLRQEM